MFIALLLTFGFCASVMQLALFREIFPVFQSNDLIMGVMLSYFIAALILGYFASTLKKINQDLKKSLLIFILALIVLFDLSYLFIRDLRVILHISLGGGISLKTTFIYIFFVVFPLSFTQMIILFLTNQLSTKLSNTTAFICASGGIILGCLTYSFFLTQTVGLNLVLSISLLTLVPLLLILRRRKLNAFILVSLVFIVLSIPRELIEHIDKILLERNFNGATIESYKYTPYGQDVLVEKNGEYTLLINHIQNFSYPDNDSLDSQDFSHIPILHHENPQNILVISGAAKYLPMVLTHKVKEVDYVEADTGIIDITKNKKIHIEEIFDDERLHIYNVNARKFIKGRKYDVILVGLPNPLNLDINSYYTSEFFKEANAALNNGGFLALKLPGTMAFSTYLMAELNLSVKKSLESVFSYVSIIPGNQNILIASQKRMPYRMHIKARLLQMQEDTLVLSKYYLDDRMDTEKTRWLRNELGRVENDNTINTDWNPDAMIFSILHWQSKFSPYLSVFLEKCIGFSYLLFVIIVIGFLLSRQVQKETSFAFGISTVWLGLISAFTVQIYNGQILKFGGIIIALFLIGFTISIISSKYVIKDAVTNKIMFYIEFLYFLWIVAWFVLFKFSLIDIPILLIFVFGTGFIGGLEVSYLIKNWEFANNYSNKKKLTLYIFASAGGWLAAFAGGGFLILVWGLEMSLIFILFVRFLVFCRWADLRKKNLYSELLGN